MRSFAYGGILLCILMLGGSQAAAQGKFVLKEKYSLTTICDLQGCFDQKQTSIMNAKGSYNFQGVDFDNMDESTEVTLNIGNFSYTNTLGNAYKYEPGDTKATFHYGIGIGDTPLLAIIHVSWENGTPKFIAKIRQTCFADDYSQSPAGEHPAPLDLEFNMTSSVSSFQISRKDAPGTAKVKHRDQETSQQSTLKTQVLVKGAFE